MKYKRENRPLPLAMWQLLLTSARRVSASYVMMANSYAKIQPKDSTVQNSKVYLKKKKACVNVLT